MGASQLHFIAGRTKHFSRSYLQLREAQKDTSKLGVIVEDSPSQSLYHVSISVFGCKMAVLGFRVFLYISIWTRLASPHFIYLILYLGYFFITVCVHRVCANTNLFFLPPCVSWGLNWPIRLDCRHLYLLSPLDGPWAPLSCTLLKEIDCL